MAYIARDLKLCKELKFAYLTNSLNNISLSTSNVAQGSLCQPGVQRMLWTTTPTSTMMRVVDENSLKAPHL